MQLRFLLQQWTACANNAKKKEQNAKRTKRRTGMNETKKTFAHSWSTLEGACYAMGKSVAATHNSQHMNWVFFFCFVSLFPSFYSFSSLPPTCIETLLFFCTALGFCSSVFWSHWWKTSSFTIDFSWYFVMQHRHYYYYAVRALVFATIIWTRTQPIHKIASRYFLYYISYLTSKNINSINRKCQSPLLNCFVFA